MKINKNILYYSISIGVFILLKISYTSANTNTIKFLLKPTSTLIELITNSNSEYIIESGYFHKELNIIIDKSCSGFNFWILCFLMLTFLGLKFINKKRYKFLGFPFILIIAYILTIIVNTSRILFSIQFQNIQTRFTSKEFSWLHQAEGTFIYLSFLILIYLGFEYILKKTSHYEKLT